MNEVAMWLGLAFLCALAFVLNFSDEVAAKWDAFWRKAWAWVVREKK